MAKLMSRRRESCVCGYESRADYIKKHQQSCTALPIIKKLKHELDELKLKLHRILTDTSKSEIESLKLQLCERDDIIRKKDEYIESLLKQIDTSHVSTDIWPYGKHPAMSQDSINHLLQNPSYSIPLYVRMKHFNDQGCSNVRIKSDAIIQILVEEFGEVKWTDCKKEDVIYKLTDDNLEEFHDEYGAKDFMWKRWYITSGLNRDGYDKTPKFLDLMLKVESLFQS